MEPFAEVLVFVGKGFSVLLFALILIITIAILIAKNQLKPQVEVEILNHKHKELMSFIRSLILKKKDLKSLLKKQKAEDKEDSEVKEKKLFILNFDGDIKASHVENLREEVTLLLDLAHPGDKVLLKLESPGGMVHSYGLAAAQLLRLKEKKITLHVSVDKMAASGGYLMAATADHILAAPFAILGSIGVIAQVPNFHRLLQKWDIDYNEYTAGE
ncbi:MAG TPA: protease SohB, partial [Pseudobdellovibrionaceae bacterium]|nr:protease SohB [Pseudobdellovibrionaceae bacterium]